MNSGFEINIDKFDLYCKEKAELYISNYGWYYMSISLHKTLFHGFQIIRKIPIPIGASSEEAVMN